MSPGKKPRRDTSPPAIARRPVTGLQPHPVTTQVVGRPTDEEVGRLARHLAQGRKPDRLIQVTPDGQVILNHAVVEAARQVGLEEVEVAVREDLVGQSRYAVGLAVIEALIEDGRLGKLDLARCVQRGQELAKWLPEAERPAYLAGTQGQGLARLLHVSVRNADRYMRLLQVPWEVQVAFDAGKVPLTVAERAANLSATARGELVDALRASEEPCQAIGRLIKPPGHKHQIVRNAWTAFMKALERGRLDLEGRIEQIKALSPEDAAVLDQAISDLRRIRETVPVVTRGEQRANLESLRMPMRQEVSPGTSSALAS